MMATIAEQNRASTFFSWATQGDVKPTVVTRAEGVYFWDDHKRRYLDFSAQLMNVNLGHGDRRVMDAVQRQSEDLIFVHPGFATAVRGQLGERLAAITPGDLCKSLFTTGGADAVENSLKIARQFTGRQKVLSRYRAYHGGTFAAATVGGDPRLRANEPGVPWVVKVHDPYAYRSPLYRDGGDGDALLLAMIEETVVLEGPDSVAAILMEGYSGSSGVIQPETAQFWQGLRDLANRYGIVLIIDEVMSGFGRTGTMFAVEHYGVVPDVMVMAKGLTSGYLPMGAVIVNTAIRDYFEDHPFVCGLTYSSHPLCCAAALATLDIMESDGLVAASAQRGHYLRKRLDALQAKHPCIGDIRGRGLHICLELVVDRDTRTPLSPWNQPLSPTMVAIRDGLWQQGLSTVVRWNYLFIMPPLVIDEHQIDDGLAIIDQVLAAHGPR